MPASPPLSNTCRNRSKAKPSARRTLIRPDLSPSSLGSPAVSAAGIVTTSRPGQRPCDTAGTSSPLSFMVMLSPSKAKIRESRSPLREGDRGRGLPHNMSALAQPLVRLSRVGKLFANEVRALDELSLDIGAHE